MKTIMALSVAFAGSITHAGQCGFPPRAIGSTWSSVQFYKQNPTPSAQREIAVVKQVLAGNIPSGLRNLQPIQIPAQIGGLDALIELAVAPDYLTIGTDDDFTRTPLTPFAAQYLASQMGFILPTPTIVDAIYNSAAVQLLPQPTDWYTDPSGALMRLGSNYIVHNLMIEAQRRGRTGLVAGHKKDVVISNLLDSQPQHVAIYGWQEPGDRPIQPLATVHEYDYEDYSHGIRLIGPTLKVHWTGSGLTDTWSTAQALRDARVGPALNGSQAAIRDVRAARQCPTDFAAELGLTQSSCPPQPVDCSESAAVQ